MLHARVFEQRNCRNQFNHKDCTTLIQFTITLIKLIIENMIFCAKALMVILIFYYYYSFAIHLDYLLISRDAFTQLAETLLHSLS